MNACYTINTKKQYLKIFNNQMEYPLPMVKELKAQHDQTYQQIANYLLKLYEKEQYQLDL